MDRHSPRIGIWGNYVLSGTLYLSSETWPSRKETEDPEARDRIRRQVEKAIRGNREDDSPHDDEPDPTAYMGNYNFPQCYLHSA